MRVLLLNYEFPPLGGGASNASLQIARTLVLHGHEVDVLTSRMGGQPALETIDGVEIRRVLAWRRGIQDSGLIGALSYLAGAAPTCARLVRERAYDVVHYFFGLPTGALLLLTPALRKLPSVISLRGSDVPGFDARSHELRWLHRLLAPASRSIWLRAGRVVANSAGLRQLAQDFLPDRTIGMIPNAVRSDLFKVSPLAAPAPEQARPMRVVAVARLVARKGLDDLIQAIALLPAGAATLEIHGAGPAAPSLADLTRSLGVDDRVQLMGYRSQADLPAVYAQSDTFVLVSHTESCSMALLEAMSSGLPVVASRVGGNPELVEEGRGGFLVPIRSPQELASALAKLASDPALRARLGAHNRARIEASYSWDAVARSYLAEYAQAIAAAGRRDDA